MATIYNVLSSRPLGQLIKHSVDVFRSHMKKENWHEARNDLAFFGDEFEERREKLSDTSHNDEYPSPGIMSSIGYRVGKRGLVTAERQLRIDYYMMMDVLPPIVSKRYMHKFGRPYSRRRYWRLEEFLSVNISNHESKDGYVDAVREWREDLEYIRSTWFEVILRMRP